MSSDSKLLDSTIESPVDSESNSYSVSNLSSSSSSDNESENEFSGISKIRKTGKQWEQLKPIDAERLYYDIVNCQEEEIEDVVSETVTTITSTKFLYSMIRLILDLADYQHFKLPEYERYSTTQCKHILQQVVNVGPKNQKRLSEYLFNNTCKVAIAIMYRIFKYYSLLVEELLVKKKLVNTQFNDFIHVLKELSETDVLSVRHTIVVVAIKLMSRFTVIMNQSEYNEVSAVSNYFNILFPIFHKNCLLKSKQLYKMNMQCIKECQFWINKSPNYFVKCIDCIKVSIVSPNCDVRYIALQVIEYIMELDHLKYLFQQRINNVMKFVEDRLIDVDYNVRIAAANVCTKALLTYNYIVSRSNRNYLKKMILDKRESIGIAGCNYYFNYIIKKNNDDLTVVLNTFLEYIEENIDYLPLIVEATLPTFHFFQDFKTMFKLLNANVLSRQDIFVRLILQCALQLVTNQTPIPRLGSVPVNTDTSEIMDICVIVLNNIPGIFDKFQTNSNCVIDAEKFLFALDQNNLALDSLSHKMDAILKQLRYIYVTTEDTSRIESLSNIIFKEHQKEMSQRKNNELQNIIITKFTQTCKNFNIDATNEELLYTNNTYLKFLCILKKIDIHMHVEYDVLLNNFAQITNNTPETLIKNIYSIFSWYLKRLLSNYRKMKLNNSNLNQELEECYTKLITICTNMLKSTCSQSVKLLTCNCIFEIFINYKVERRYFEAIDSSGTYLNLLLNEPLQLLLYDCLKRNVFISKIGTLEERKEILGNYLHVLLNGQISYNYLLNTFIYYQKLIEYEEVFTGVFNVLNPKNRLFVVGETIKLAYGNNLEPTRTHELSEEYNNVLQLSNGLIKLLKPTECRIFLENVINHSQKNKEYKVLDFFLPAVIRLPLNDCLPLISFALKTFGSSTHNSNVNKFINSLNRRYENVPVKKKKKKKAKV